MPYETYFVLVLDRLVKDELGELNAKYAMLLRN